MKIYKKWKNQGFSIDMGRIIKELKQKQCIKVEKQIVETEEENPGFSDWDAILGLKDPSVSDKVIKEKILFTKAQGEFTVCYQVNDDFKEAVENKLLEADRFEKIKILNKVLGKLLLRIDIKTKKHNIIELKISEDKGLSKIMRKH